MALEDWWVAEIEHDPAYREEVIPLLLELLDPRPGERYLDAGCGEGQGLRAVAGRGARVVGCDLNDRLLRRARRSAPVVRARLPALDWLAEGSLDGAYLVLVVEHLEEPGALLEGLARVVRPGGCLVVVMNHPVFTAPGSGPIVDPRDGEVLWRWGSYLEEGRVREPAGGGQVTFFHRPLGQVLGVAARTGWTLERLVERGAGEGAAQRDPLLARQVMMPRLLGARWRR